LSVSEAAKTGHAAADGWGDVACGIAAMLADAPWVAGLRLRRLARGGAPSRYELALMVAEKYVAHAAYARALASGGFGGNGRQWCAFTVAYYGRWVSDNRRRLSRGG
jgi:hypothetical protein